MLSIQNTETTNTFDFWRQRTNEMAIAFSNCVITTDANTSSTSATGNAAITGLFTASNGFSSSNTGRYFVGNSTANGILSPLIFRVGNTAANVTISSNVVTLANNTLVITSNTSTNAVINSTSVILSNSSSNVTLTIPASSEVSDGSYFLNANGSWSSIGSVSLISSGEDTSVTTANRTVDSYSITDFRGAEYILTISDNGSTNNKHISKILTMHNTGEAYLTEYGQIISNTSAGSMGYTNARISSGNLILEFIPTTVSSVSVKFTRIAVPL